MSRFKGRRFSLLLILILTLSVVLQGLTPVAFAEEAPAGSAASDYETHWAKEAILSAMASGIVQGYPDGSFKPNNAITRAEFFVMVNNAFKFTATSPVTFSDVSADAWYAPHVARAQAAGYITGYPDGTIRPGNNITRQEAAAIIFNLKKLVADESVIASFADASLFPAWSKGPVGAVVKAGIMKGYPDNTFKPAGLITRAESVMVVQNSQAAQPMMISIAGIPGVTAPATGSTPVAAITATAQYTGTVSWSPAATSFSGGTVYTATITLTPKPGFTLMGVPANFFTVAGATATNAAGSGVVTAVFPATQAAFFGGGFAGGGAVTKTDPVISWTNPADINYGTPLSETQMNATSNVAGTFVYTPAIGTVLGIGNSQQLSVVFAPANTNSYNTVTKTVFINVKKATAQITLDNETLVQTYNASSKHVTAKTEPFGLNYSVTYNGSPDAPTNAGSYAVIATINDSIYSGTATGTLIIQKAAAAITLTDLTQVFGSTKPVTATTNPVGLTVHITYNGSDTPPSDEGSYPVVATVVDDNYEGTQNGTLIIITTGAEIILDTGTLNQVYDGIEKSVTATTSPAGLLYTVTYNGSSVKPVNAGAYEVVATIDGGLGSTTGELIIQKAVATVSLSDLTQTYDGLGKPATVITSPSALTVSTIYKYISGAELPGPPTEAGGPYTVESTVIDPNYSGSATGYLTINRRPVKLVLGNLLQQVNSYSGITVEFYDGTTKIADQPFTLYVYGEVTTPGAINVKAQINPGSVTNYSGIGTGVLVLVENLNEVLNLDNLIGVMPTNGNNGKIINASSGMEYSSNGTNYSPVSGTEITGLASGTYYVRYISAPVNVKTVVVPAPVAIKSTEGTVIFTFDDGWRDNYTKAWPILNAAGFKGTIYLNSSIIEWPTLDDGTIHDKIMKTDDMDKLYAYGWDLSNHTTNHKDFERYPDNSAILYPIQKQYSSPLPYVQFASRTDRDALAIMEAAYKDNQQWLMTNGWSRGAAHAAYPSGLWSEPLIQMLKSIGVLTGRLADYGSGSAGQPTIMNKMYKLPVQYVETEFGTSGANLAAVKSAINAVDPGETLIFMIHRVSDQKVNETSEYAWLDDLIVTTNEFQQIVDEVKSQGLNVMTISEWYASQAAVTISGISLDKATMTIPLGAEDWLNPSIAPVDFNAPLTWSSSNPLVAEVDPLLGRITAKSIGTTTVTVQTGSFSASCIVTVIPEIEITGYKALPVVDILPGSFTLDKVIYALDTVFDRSITLMAGTNEYQVRLNKNSDTKINWTVTGIDPALPTGNYVLSGTLSKLPPGYVFGAGVEPISVSVTINVSP